MDANQGLKLNDATLQIIMENNGITKEQAKDLWSKSISFNKILMEKYGDTYTQNLNEITKITKQYMRKVVEKYKAK